MHSALLIDEVLQTVLDSCNDWDRNDYLRTVGRLARSCKAWTDPALDRLWKDLQDTRPLVDLMHDSSDGSCKTEVSLNESFLAYASRVRKISINTPPPFWTVELKPPHSPVLSNVTAVSLRRQGCMTPVEWIASNSLRELKISHGIAETSHTDQQCTHLVKVIEALHLVSDHPVADLRKLAIRGWMSPSLNNAIGMLTSLRTLSLNTGTSLSPQLLLSLATFPFLQKLSIHASHINPDAFQDILHTNTTSGQTFPSLQHLTIRAQQSLASIIIDLLPIDVLETFRLEGDYTVIDPTDWEPTLVILSRKASRSLTHLTLQHTLELDQIDNSAILLRADIRFTLNTLRPLATLRNLRKFTLDLTIPPNLDDRDIEEIANWWPRLECLDLGTVPDLQDYVQLQAWHPKMTITSFLPLARKCTKLQTLVVPLDLSTLFTKPSPDSPVSNVKRDHSTTRQRVLERLCIGHISPPKCDVPALVKYVLDVFPEVDEIECISVDGSMPLDVENCLKDMRRGLRRISVGTEDGLANGHQ